MKKDDDELDKYLSGETPLAELPEGLRLEEERLRGLVESLQEDVRAPLALRDAVMREVAEIPVPLWRRLADWSFRPRTVRLSPAAGALEHSQHRRPSSSSFGPVRCPWLIQRLLLK